MPSEYIMYMSVLLVGTLAIAGISVTLISIDNTMEDKAIETNLENILQKISEIIHDLRYQGSLQIEMGATSFAIDVVLTLPSNIHEQDYIIEIEDRDSSYYLTATLTDDSTFSISIKLFIDSSDILLYGSIQSSSSVPRVVFNYDGSTSQIQLVE